MVTLWSYLSVLVMHVLYNFYRVNNAASSYCRCILIPVVSWLNRTVILVSGIEPCDINYAIFITVLMLWHHEVACI